MLFLCSIFGQNMDNLINLCDAGSCIVGRAPWPVTVVLRLVSPGAKQVGRPEEHRHLRQVYPVVVVIEWVGFKPGDVDFLCGSSGRLL